jgi:hypothetical protein
MPSGHQANTLASSSTHADAGSVGYVGDAASVAVEVTDVPELDAPCLGPLALLRMWSSFANLPVRLGLPPAHIHLHLLTSQPKDLKFREFLPLAHLLSSDHLLTSPFPFSRNSPVFALLLSCSLAHFAPSKKPRRRSSASRVGPPLPLNGSLFHSRSAFRNAGKQEPRKRPELTIMESLLASCLPAFLIFPLGPCRTPRGCEKIEPGGLPN